MCIRETIEGSDGVSFDPGIANLPKAPEVEIDSAWNDSTSAYLTASASTVSEPEFDTEDLMWDQPQPAVESDQFASFSKKDFPHTPLPKEDPEVAYRLTVLREAMLDLGAIKEGKTHPAFDTDPVGFAMRVINQLPCPELFVAGGVTPVVEVWRQFFAAHKSRNPVRQILRIVESGLNFHTVSPLHEAQTAMPGYKQKLRRVERMLSRVGLDPQAVLSADKPPAAEFPNHLSASEHEEFLVKEIGKFVERGAVIPVSQRPSLVHPVGVVVQRTKLRLILDPAVLNMFLRYLPFKYEQLRDITTMISESDWAYSSDDKAGYHHIPLHPAMWSLLGFRVNGQYYVFTHLPFGVGPACRIYTMIKDEIFRVIRLTADVRMSFLIDDQIGFAPTYHAALFQSVTVLRILWALGFTVGKDKSAFFPVQNPTWLGMTVDIPQLAFVVPDHKISEFQLMIQELLTKESVTFRDLASAAGKLLSFAPAIRLAKLYCRVLYNCMKGAISDWDKEFTSPEELLLTMSWVAQQLPGWNGLSWKKSTEVLLVAGDYSSTHGYAAFTPYGELSEPIVVSLTPEELEAISTHSLSSTYGELKAIYHTLDVLVTLHPHLVVGRTLCYECDNQATVAIVNGMKGNEHNFPLVRKLWELAKAHNVDVVTEWHPRSTQNQEVADWLSKLSDNSEWLLADWVYEQKVRTAVQMFGYDITQDVFASSTNAKVPRFFSRYWCPGTAGVDAFMQKWAVDQQGNKMFSYINGDFSRMGEILQKIRIEQCNCVVVYPMWPRYWQSLWAALPVRFHEVLPSSWDLFTPGPRVPKGKLAGKPHFSVGLAVIIF